MENVTRALEFLREAKVYYLATAEGDQPRVRPFGGISEYEGRLYIPTSNKKRVWAQVTENPKVEICAMLGGQWIRIEARLVRDERREARQAMLDEYGEALTRMYSVDDGKFEVAYLEGATATIVSFTDAPETFEF